MYIVNLKNGNIKTTIHGRKQKLRSGNVVQGINTIDSFSFTLYPTNNGYNVLNEFTTLVTVYDNTRGKYEFYGRVLKVFDAMDESGFITKEVVCESYLGFLCDSKQKYVAEKNWTVKGLLQQIIDTHNAKVEDYKKFAIGDVTVTDPNDNLYVGIQRKSTWETIKEKLIDKLGGEIRFRVVNDVIYLDYLQEIGTTHETSIALSKNMKSITKESDPTEYITRLIPLGAKIKDADGNETEERLDITNVNNGIEYIEDTVAREVYGIHEEIVEFDNVTTAEALLTKGQEYLTEVNKLKIKYTINAIDLSLLGLDIFSFVVHDRYQIINLLLGIEDTARIVKKNIDICEEVKTNIELGETFKKLSDIQLEQKKNFAALQDVITKAENNLKEYVENIENGLKEDIEGIEIGGRNLILDSNKIKTMTASNTNNTFYEVIYSGLEDGETYTLSGMFSVSNTSDLRCSVRLYNVEDGTGGEEYILTADGTRQKITFTVGENTPDLLLYAGVRGATKGITLNYNQIKLEKGNISTDYTEAPEDAENRQTQTTLEQITIVKNDCEAIILEALESYTETSDFESYKETVSSQLQLMADEMQLKFTETIQEIENVNGDLQEKYNTITKYFTFNIDGLTIGQVDNPNQVVIDNDEISILVNGNVVQKFDANGDALIPKLKITTALDLLGFLINKDENGNVNCECVGGET